MKAILKWLAAVAAAGALAGLNAIIAKISAAAPADVDALLALVISAAVVKGVMYLISKIPAGA